MTNKELKQILIENRGSKTITPKGKMFLRLPIKYFDRVEDLCLESDLVDDCKYLLKLEEGWYFCDCETVPVRSISEAIQFTKEAYYREEF